MKKNTLLEKAMAAPGTRRRGQYSDDEIGLAVAWIKGQISAGQVAAALNRKSVTNIFTWLPYRLRAAYEKGLIK
jgi:hypothetical protein